MKITREDQGKSNKFYKLNSAGSRIKSYTNLSFLFDEEKSSLLEIGEYDDLYSIFCKKCGRKDFSSVIFNSNSWIQDSIANIINNPSILSSEDDEKLVDQGKVGVTYHNFLIMEPDWEHEKEMDKIRKKEIEIAEGDPLDKEKAEKRRQRSLKAAETRRRRQLENGKQKI